MREVIVPDLVSPIQNTDSEKEQGMPAGMHNIVHYFDARDPNS